MQKLLKFFQVIHAIFEKKSTIEGNNDGVNRTLDGKLDILCHLYYSVSNNFGWHLAIPLLIVPVLLSLFAFYPLQCNLQDWKVK